MTMLTAFISPSDGLRISSVTAMRTPLVARTIAPSMVALTGATLDASLKMRCEIAGASYAMYWAKVGDKFVVAGTYVEDAYKAELAAQGKTSSFPEESEGMRLDAKGGGPVACTYRMNDPMFIRDAPTASIMKRSELAREYNIKSVAFVNYEDGVLEFGTPGEWSTMPSVPRLPKVAIRTAFESIGSSYVLLWQEQGDELKVTAGYTTPERRAALKAARGDDVTFESKSRAFTIDANGDGLIATALKTRKAQFIKDPSASKMKRAELAKEFGIGSIHFVSTGVGVLEYGVPASARLDGDALGAVLKWRCEASGAGYGIYWTEVGGSFVQSGSYVTPERKAELQERGISGSLAEESASVKLPADGDGPIATVAKTGQSVFIADARSSEMKRAGLAEKYGVVSIALIPVEGGVLEFGTSDGASTSDWSQMPYVYELPIVELKRAFEAGAQHATLWQQKGDNFYVLTSYVTPAHIRAQKSKRGDDKTFCSESANVEIDATGEGPVATAKRSGTSICVDSSGLVKRSELAKEFGIGSLTFVPVTSGVLEYGLEDACALL